MKCPGELEELFEVLYGLTGSEAAVLYELCDGGGRASELAERLERDRSTVQRYLSTLRETGLVKRTGKVEEGKKGRFYVYTVVDREELKAEVRRRIQAWEQERLEALDRLLD